MRYPAWPLFRLTVIAAIALAGVFESTLARGQTGSEECELHVWGAVPAYKPGTFAGPGARIGTPDADRSDPVSNINVFDPLVRLRGISDARIGALLGNPDKVRVVRHDQPIDVKLAKSSRVRLASSESICYADLVLLELYDVGGPPNPHEYRGLLLELLMARAGFHATFVFNRFGPGLSPIARTKDSRILPLAITRPDWRKDPAAAVAALDNAVAVGIDNLAASTNAP